MIHVNDIINYKRTDAELEELILFLICVAGKKADRTATQLEKYLHPVAEYTPKGKIKKSTTLGLTPFELVRIHVEAGILQDRIRAEGFGCYTRLTRAFTEIATSGIDLRTCTKEDLMQIHGIGRKSASCFLAWTRKGVRVAMLDTHLLKKLREVVSNCRALDRIDLLEKPYFFVRDYYDIKIPKSTPSSKKLYTRLEKFWLEICDTKKVDSTAFDLEIWRSYTNK